MQYHDSSLHYFFLFFVFVDAPPPGDEPSTSSMANHPPRTVSSSRLSPIVMESPAHLGPSHSITEDVEEVRHSRHNALNPAVIFRTIVFILIYTVHAMLFISVSSLMKHHYEIVVFSFVYLLMPLSFPQLLHLGPNACIDFLLLKILRDSLIGQYKCF